MILTSCREFGPSNALNLRKLDIFTFHFDFFANKIVPPLSDKWTILRNFDVVEICGEGRSRYEMITPLPKSIFLNPCG